MPKPKAQQKCSVSTCYYSVCRNEDGDTVSYFRLPKEKYRAKLWLQAIGRKANSPRVVVCEMHFTRNFISINNRRTRLVPTAVPTLHLPQPGDLPFSAHCDPPTSTLPPLAPNGQPSQSLPALGPNKQNTRAFLDAVGGRPAHALPTTAPPSPCHQAAQIPDSNAESSVKLEPPDDNDVEIDYFVKEETVVSQKRPYSAMEPSTSSVPDWSIKRERLHEDEASNVTPERQAELKKLVQLGNAHLEPELAKYIEANIQMKNATTLSQGRNCDKNLLLFALKLYHAFPQTYKVMQKPLGLPSMIQIKRLFRPLKWELNEHWAQILRTRFSGASPAQRECVVCVARAPLKAALAYDAACDRLIGLHELAGQQRLMAAREVVILVARGIYSPWRQPLACCLFGARADVSEIRLWIDRVISTLFDIDLNVRALINDFDDLFIPTGPFLKFEKPYFTVNTKKIYCFYDCTKLMISFRDYFMQYNINYGGLIASWEDIEDMHDYNSTRAYPLPTGLTSEHLQPPPQTGAAQRARLAVEALSRPVAAALAAAVDLRVLGDTAHGTVQLVEVVARLYDTMHNQTLSCGTKASMKNKGSTNEIKFLNEMIAHLEKMSLVRKDNGYAVTDPGLLAAMRAGVHAAMALHERARRGPVAALPMRAFNNDPLHEFFDRLRAGDSCKIPGKQMLVAFKRSFAFNVMKSLKTAPKDVQFEEFLKAASEIRSVPPHSVEPCADPVSRASAMREPGEQPGAPLRVARGRRSAPGLARHLLERCLQRHGGCELARGYCQSEKLPEGLLRYMELMSFKFRSHFEQVVAARGAVGLLDSLVRLMDDLPFEAPCGCFPTLYLKRIFFRFKIQTLVAFNNNRLRRSPNGEIVVNMNHVDLRED